MERKGKRLLLLHWDIMIDIDMTVFLAAIRLILFLTFWFLATCGGSPEGIFPGRGSSQKETRNPLVISQFLLAVKKRWGHIRAGCNNASTLPGSTTLRTKTRNELPLHSFFCCSYATEGGRGGERTLSLSSSGHDDMRGVAYLVSRDTKILKRRPFRSRCCLQFACSRSEKGR